jgi:hypothetical protein
MGEMPEQIRRVSAESREIGFVPAAVRHFRRQSAEKAESVHGIARQQHRCRHTVVAVKNREWLPFIPADKQDRTQFRALGDERTQASDLHAEGLVSNILRAISVDLLDNFGEGEVASRQLAPMCTRKYIDPGQVCPPHFNFEPLRVLGKFSP